MKKITYSIIALLSVATLAQADIDSISDVEAKYSNKSTIEAQKELKQSFNLGFSTTSGNTETLNANGKYDASFITSGYDNQELKVGFDTSAFFTENNSVKSNQEFTANLGLEQIIANGWLGYMGVNWLNNPDFKNYDSKTAIGIGLGKELYKDATQSLLFKLGTSYNILNYANAQATDEFGALNQYVEYHNQLNKVSKFYFKAGAMENYDDMSHDYEVLSAVGVNVAVAQNLSLTLEAEVNYDNLPSVGFKKTDTKTIVRLGYNF